MASCLSPPNTSLATSALSCIKRQWPIRCQLKRKTNSCRIRSVITRLKRCQWEIIRLARQISTIWAIKWNFYRKSKRHGSNYCVISRFCVRKIDRCVYRQSNSKILKGNLTYVTWLEFKLICKFLSDFCSIESKNCSLNINMKGPRPRKLRAPKVVILVVTLGRRVKIKRRSKIIR